MKKLKKGSPAAKARMAKVRAAKKKKITFKGGWMGMGSAPKGFASKQKRAASHIRKFGY